MHGSSIAKYFKTLERCFKISSFVACMIFPALSLAAEPSPTPDPIEKALEKMSVEEKTGQLMIWTFGGTSFDSIHRETLSKYKLGAFIVFSRNIKSLAQIAKFNGDAQAFARKNLKAPLLIMVDQEGGTVTRVKVSTPIPSALALAQVEDPEFIEDYGKTKGELLATLGFNVNLAPVLDVSDPGSDSFIANRAFSNDPKQVAKLSMAYSRGLSAAGIIPTAKHFPGHGGMVNDSHTSTPKKLATLEELKKRDLVPFLEYIAADFPRAIMMAHMSLPNVDPSGVPATYSPLIIQDQLRDAFGYQGLVITDDLEMGGASTNEDIGERAVKAFLAGNDMLMFAGPPKNQRKAFEALVAAVKSERISQDRLNESVRRILKVKLTPKAFLTKYEPKKSQEQRLHLEALSREVMRKNFKKSIDAKSARWPKVSEETKVLVLASDARFFEKFSATFSGKSDFLALAPDTLKKVRGILAKDETVAAIFYASGNVTSNFLNTLPHDLKAKLIVINCTNPGRVDQQEDFLSVLNLSSQSPESGEWLAEALNTSPELRVPASRAEGDDVDDSPEEPTAEPEQADGN